MACLVRVPTEVIKAKMQTAAAVEEATKQEVCKVTGRLITPTNTLGETIRLVLSERHGSSLSFLTGGLYRGFDITIMREIPFALIQFPLYERFKVICSQQLNNNNEPTTPIQAAACGSVAGGIAAALTTPLDVIKTRLMIGIDKNGIHYKSAYDVLKRTYTEEGYTALLSGIQPRVFWISLGGFIFFGAYESFRTILMPVLG